MEMEIPVGDLKMEGGEGEEEGRRDSVEVPGVDEKRGKLDGQIGRAHV